MSYNSLMSSATNRFKMEQTPGELCKDEKNPAYYTNFSQTDYLSVGVPFDFDSTTIRIRYVANRDTVQQCLVGWGYVQPVIFIFEPDGRLRITVRTSGDAINNIDLPVVSEGTLVDYSITLESTSDNIIVYDNIAKTTTPYSQSLIDAYAVGNLVIGKYSNAGVPSITNAFLELIEVSYNGVKTHSYDFREDPIKDLEPSGTDLTKTGSPDYVADTYNALVVNSPGLVKDGGQSVDFDGTNQFITLSESPIELATEFSVSFWIKPNIDATNFRGILGFGQSSDRQLWIYYKTDSAFSVNMSTTGQSNDGSVVGFLVDGESNHVLVTWDGTSKNLKLYVDSVNVSSDTTVNDTLISASGTHTIGKTTTEINADLDDVVFWNTELTQENATDLYNGPESSSLVDPSIAYSVGYKLSIDNGTWEENNGTNAFSYQWYRADDATGLNSVLITGENEVDYTAAFTDQNKYIVSKVSVSNDGGNDPDSDILTNYVLSNNNVVYQDSTRMYPDTYSYYVAAQDILNSTGTSDGTENLDVMSYSIGETVKSKTIDNYEVNATINDITGDYQNRFTAYL